MTDKEKIAAALSVAVDYGSIDGAHHKAWVIDQMVHRLTENKYDAFVAVAKAGKNGPNTYEWSTGIVP